MIVFSVANINLFFSFKFSSHTICFIKKNKKKKKKREKQSDDLIIFFTAVVIKSLRQLSHPIWIATPHSDISNKFTAE